MVDRFDPKLKELMDELQPIFNRYGVFGFVNAVSRTHGEFRWFIPDHSVMKIESRGVRFKAKSGEDKHEDVEHTVFALLSLKDQAADLFQVCDQLKLLLDEHMKIDHKRSAVYGHGED